ncbi:splicing factor 3A subunit 3 [Sporothrix schenckii 1099-18]|uniref:Splicing factor 3A subunit 3 n=1 Tax=Sporothrix schenckii 1099-18 TaxID=1397361 RepID=A0A0F2M7H7_SPOSC|nr:splicing factor 3A subunit 3 [Sporothrix schenckii 1099-18]KJR85024.1 splicing factor 3A subunit 3 [Sporothrix schenckii 1099-18]
MLLEEIRYILEDLERLEQAVVDRLVDEPTQVRDRLNREHEVAQLLDHMQAQSGEALRLYGDAHDMRADEVSLLGDGDPLQLFYRNLDDTLAYHQRYPTDQLDQPELRYRHRPPQPLGEYGYGEFQPTLVDTMFSGEEGFGRYFDLNANYEAFVNLPNVKRLTYLQYLEVFDQFGESNPFLASQKRSDKLTDDYFQYIGGLADYLQGFMRKTRPLENLDRVFAGFDDDFEALWSRDELPSWKTAGSLGAAGGESAGSTADGGAGGSTPQLSSPEAVWCADCEKEFKNQNVYKGHLTGRKHVRAAEQRAQAQSAASHDGSNGNASGVGGAAAAAAHRLKEKAVAAREYRVQRLVAAMSTEKDDTRVNVERRQGMTERERRQELDNLYAMLQESAAAAQAMDVDGGGGRADGQGGEAEGDNDDDDDKVYNPLKLPLAWDGKPIPFWLYRLHGLGVEFDCEICGQYTYMGRRAFEKHFNESRHIHGLRCLGINNPGLFRDITKIEEALRLWDKLEKEKKRNKQDESSVVQMEDAEGHVMPEKVYYDLQKQGLV